MRIPLTLFWNSRDTIQQCQGAATSFDKDGEGNGELILSILLILYLLKV